MLLRIALLLDCKSPLFLANRQIHFEYEDEDENPPPQ
jgi:hypothetical protein